MSWTKWVVAGAAAAALLGGCRSDDAGVGGSGEEGEAEDVRGHEGHSAPGQQYEQGSPLEGDTSARPSYEGEDIDIASPSESDRRENK